MKPISALQPPTAPAMPMSLRGAMPSRSVEGGADPSRDFAKLLFDKFGEVNAMQTDADDKVHSMLTGGSVNEAEVLTAVQKSDLAFRMMMQVRNKLIEAYRELQQIQI